LHFLIRFAYSRLDGNERIRHLANKIRCTILKWIFIGYFSEKSEELQRGCLREIEYQQSHNTTWIKLTRKGLFYIFRNRILSVRYIIYIIVAVTWSKESDHVRSHKILIWWSVPVNETWSDSSDQITVVMINLCTIKFTYNKLIKIFQIIKNPNILWDYFLCTWYPLWHGWCYPRKMLHCCCLASPVSESTDTESKNHNVVIWKIGAHFSI
jgi:hypothetical protein